MDDALMGVTDVFRGDDLLSNTPQLIIVYQALGFAIPKFFHVPMINNAEGKKLSKRDGATDVMEYKTMGYLPQALLNFLVRLGWSHGDQEIFSMEEMLELFDPSNINKSASSFNAEKLNWLNGQMIKNMDNAALEKELTAFDVRMEHVTSKELLLNAVKEKAKTLTEVAQSVTSIIAAPSEYDPEGYAKHISPEAITLLEGFLDALTSSNETFHSPSDYKEVVDGFCTASGIKMMILAHPLRIALVGSTHSPALSDLLMMIGTEEIASRITALVTHFHAGQTAEN
jgi:glutamyl-tRNA synthetase